MNEIMTRKRCYNCDRHGIDTEGNNCTVCGGAAYLIEWITVEEFLEWFIKPEARI